MVSNRQSSNNSLAVTIHILASKTSHLNRESFKLKFQYKVFICILTVHYKIAFFAFLLLSPSFDFQENFTPLVKIRQILVVAWKRVSDDYRDEFYNDFYATKLLTNDFYLDTYQSLILYSLSQFLGSQSRLFWYLMFH